MCGVVGCIGAPNANQEIYDALTLLQHRGQDAAGMVTSDGERFFLRKSNGLVRDVMKSRHMLRLLGSVGIGHVRYPTAGSTSEAEAQPFYVNSPYGIALAHNGNLINADELKEALWHADLRHLNTTSDSEIILNVFAHELQRCQTKQLKAEDIFKAVKAVHARCQGAYAIVAIISGYGLVAFRDPHGIRPLCYGIKQTVTGDAYMVASESVALGALGYTHCGDVLPGEALFVDLQGNLHKAQCANEPKYTPCIFEHVYLARPDSLMDKISVYKVRLKLGDYLADKIKQDWGTHDIDVVMPVPDTSRVAAYSLALRLGLKYREGLVKNHYVGRTFIMPGQKKRKRSVRQKLNAIDLEFRGKNVLLVDDSIVRGTTSKEIIQMARDAGAKNVYFASAAPEVRYPNVYGIDMPAAEELIAHNRSVEQICEVIGADKLIFQDLTDLVDAAREGNADIKRFEDSVFTGNYITGGVDEAYLAALGAKRNDSAREKTRVLTEHMQIDLHNDDN